MKNQLIESVAKVIYEQWASLDGFVPWVPSGNSFKQDEARNLAMKAIHEDLETSVFHEIESRIEAVMKLRHHRYGLY